MSSHQHRLAAVWFADLSGFSRWASRDEDQALRLVALFQGACEDMVARFRGRVVKFLGDGALAEFSSTEAAVKAACSLTHAFPGIAEREGLIGAKLHVGIHVGEVASGPDGDLYGEGVNVASRLEGLAEGDQVLASMDVRNQLHHRAEFDFEPLGERSIEGMDISIPVYQVSFLRVEGWETMGESPGRVRRRALRDRLTRPGSRLGFFGFGVLLALVAIGLTIRFFPRAESEGVAPQFFDDRVAVLYFEDFTPDRHLGFLVDGLTESLIHELSEVSGLEVVSRNGVKPFAGTDASVDSIARALGARTLVQGSVSESDELLRINVQLIDGPTGTVVQSERLEHPRGELFALQDDLGQRVADFLRRRLGEEVRLRELKAGSQNVEAWELVQHARQIREEAIPLLRSGDTGVTGVQFARADSLLARAESLDPNWVEPIVERGRLALEVARTLFRASLRGTEVETKRWIEIGLDHARRALERERDHAGALELRGTLRYLWWLAVEPGMDSERASRLLGDVERDLRAAIDAEPNRASAHATLSHLLAARGAPVEAYMEARKAYEADAYLEDPDMALWRLFTSAYDFPQPEEAARWCKEGLQRFAQDPRFVQCGIWMASMPDTRVDPKEVWSLYQLHRNLVPAQPENLEDRMALMAVAAALARAGLPDSAQAVARRARADQIDPGRELAYHEAFVETLAGDEEGALVRLSEYLQASPGQRSEVATTWWFRDLRDSPAFRRLVESEGS
jgi:class 3 adenylate cyclase/TolB-like protein